MNNIGFEFNNKIFWNLHNQTLYNTNNICLKVNLKSLSFQNIKAGIETLKEGQPPLGFTFEISWPGLYSGLGYTHHTGKSNEEFKTGFSFDYITGLPIITSSSVKGILRSFFPKRYSNIDKQNKVKERLESIIDELFNKKIDLDRLEFEVFGETENEDIKSKPRGRMRFGAACVSLDNPDSSKIFSIDTITPHSHPLEEPVPLRTLSICPGIKLDFHIEFKHTSQLTSIEIKALFKYLLLEFGVGAKTNVGYGQFKNENNITDNVSDGYLGFLESVTENTSGWVPIEDDFSGLRNGSLVFAEYIGDDQTGKIKKFKLILKNAHKDIIVSIRYFAQLQINKIYKLELIMERNKNISKAIIKLK